MAKEKIETNPYGELAKRTYEIPLTVWTYELQYPSFVMHKKDGDIYLVDRGGRLMSLKNKKVFFPLQGSIDVDDIKPIRYMGTDVDKVIEMASKDWGCGVDDVHKLIKDFAWRV
jgi:hypothetical protein